MAKADRHAQFKRHPNIANSSRNASYAGGSRRMPRSGASMTHGALQRSTTSIARDRASISGFAPTASGQLPTDRPASVTSRASSRRVSHTSVVSDASGDEAPQRGYSTGGRR